jgi:hypothetical protein
MLKPFFQIDDARFVNIMSVGMVEFAHDKDWVVTMTTYPSGERITIEGEKAKLFLELHSNLEMGKRYL